MLWKHHIKLNDVNREIQYQSPDIQLTNLMTCCSKSYLKDIDEILFQFLNNIILKWYISFPFLANSFKLTIMYKLYAIFVTAS